MSLETGYTFIVNPHAGRRRAAGRVSDLRRAVGGRADTEVLSTACAGHAAELAAEAASGGRAVISCGGDGTLHEVLNAVMGTGSAVGVLPFGSANDFLKTFGPDVAGDRSPESQFGAVRTRVDVGRVEFSGGEMRHFLNSLGIGFTGRIASAVKRAPWLKGELAYAYALFRVLIGYAPVKMHIEITLPDRLVVLDERVFAFSVGNGKVEGGKFQIAPAADLRDGLLDVCILRAVPKWEIPGLVLQYLRGVQSQDHRVRSYQAERIDVSLDGPDVMHMDGEVYEGIDGKITVAVVPEGLEMLAPGRHG
ncbi:MAG: diacylglycerol kinase [Pelodictyon luteolum]|uniref:Diacylglycerol kinase n=1 Tax=Pelodictyon luteolum TaxID=1100 RepID=A0A165L396_PELLU|nr:YegS/Rv2252/BmrU family lipid kinase [Pelodictyon luteolum]KZK73521.1 MAG: diacylglycerol kinase [Pelodictyon luteolum]